MNKSKTITLAIEHSERELDPKILLAKYLLRHGWRVIIGSTEAIDRFLLRAKPCVVFHKSTFDKMSSVYKSRGHYFCFLDEEGGPATPKAQFHDFCLQRYQTISKDRQDLIFFPSEKYIAEVRKITDTDGVQLIASGWPRADLWGARFSSYFEDDVARIKDEHGKFFLFVSSFGALTETRWKQTLDQDPSEESRRIHNYRKSRLGDYVGLLRKIQNSLSPDEKLIVRPHPSEDTSTWRRLMTESTKVEIIRNGNVSPWIMAAAGVLNFGSTTAIQAALLGKPTAQFDVEQIVGVTDSPAFQVIPNAKSSDEVLAMLRGEIPSSDQSAARQLLRDELLIDDKELAVQKIVREINRFDPTGIDLSSFRLIDKLMANYYYFGSLIKKTVREKLALAGEQTVAEKIPGGLSGDHLLKQLEKIDDGVQEKNRVTSIKLARNLIALESAQ